MNIKEIQAALGIKPDGVVGPVTVATVIQALHDGRLSVATTLPNLKGVAGPPIATTPPNLKGVHYALASIIEAAAMRSPVRFDVIEGLRTAERQAELFKAGKSKTTNSRHLTGHAVDLWPLDPATGKPLPSDAAYKAGSPQAKAANDRLWADLRTIAGVVKAVAKERGVALEWGGDWGWDGPHFQLNRAAYPA